MKDSLPRCALAKINVVDTRTGNNNLSNIVSSPRDADARQNGEGVLKRYLWPVSSSTGCSENDRLDAMLQVDSFPRRSAK